ncbi:hypothetical protein F4818DRAFT_224560 [Hypoxylon cercidicola]|nr:hypothetical protein F4818DRAFT_224560 [Hypoxylon cercidicola]
MPSTSPSPSQAPAPSGTSPAMPSGTSPPALPPSSQASTGSISSNASWLVWRRVLWVGFEDNIPIPCWTYHYRVDSLLKKIKPYLADLLNRHWGITAPLDVTFLNQGSFNRAFLVRICSDDSLHTAPKSTLPPLPNQVVLRLALPILPEIKILSEVATMRYVKHRTSIPVPQVYMYNASAANDLEFEWILMEYMPGQRFGDVEPSLSDDARKLFARKIADWVDSLSHLQFDEIGSLYMPCTTTDPPSASSSTTTPDGTDDGTVVISTDAIPDPVIGQLSNLNYTGDWRLEYDFNRGPFRNLQDFILSGAKANFIEVRDPRQQVRAEFNQAYIKREEASKEGEAGKALAEKEGKRVEELRNRRIPIYWSGGPDSDNWESRPRDQITSICQYDDDVPTCPVVMEFGQSFFRYAAQDLEQHREVSKRLMDLVYSIIPNTPLGPRSTVLNHWDINGGNVLVDGTGQPTALLDWEFIFTMPFTLAQFYPKVLDVSMRDQSDSERDPSDPEREAMWKTEKMEEEFHERMKELKSPWLVVNNGREYPTMGRKSPYSTDLIVNLLYVTTGNRVVRRQDHKMVRMLEKKVKAAKSASQKPASAI